MTWRLLLPVPVVQSGPNAGKQVPYNSANSYVSPMVRSSRTKRHRGLAGRNAYRIRVELGLPPAEGKKRVRGLLVRGPRQRLLDIEGVYAALKPYVDALVDAGWLVDDAPKWCDYAAAQVVNRELGPLVIFTVSSPVGEVGRQRA